MAEDDFLRLFDSDMGKAAIKLIRSPPPLEAGDFLPVSRKADLLFLDIKNKVNSDKIGMSLYYNRAKTKP